MNKYSKTRIMIECALLIALGTILAQIKIYRMPSGGSVTLLSMLPFLLISFRHGAKWGLLSGAANAALQMAIGGVYPPPAGTVMALIGSILLDYVLAYMILGVACVFAKPFKNKVTGVVWGSLCACFLRFVFSVLSGFIIWGSLTDGIWGAFIYSLSYNAAYMVPEVLLTIAGVYILAKTNYRTFFNKI